MSGELRRKREAFRAIVSELNRYIKLRFYMLAFGALWLIISVVLLVQIGSDHAGGIFIWMILAGGIVCIIVGVVCHVKVQQIRPAAIKMKEELDVLEDAAEEEAAGKQRTEE